MLWRFSLYNDSVGQIYIDDPVTWESTIFQLQRDTDRHGVMKEFNLDFTTADARAIKWIENIFETTFIDTNVEIIVEEKASDVDAWAEVFRGKLNLDQKKKLRTKLGALTLSATITKSQEEMRFYEKRDQLVDLESNLDFEGNSLTAYPFLPSDLTLKPRTIIRQLDLENTYAPSTQVANTNGYENGILQTSCGGTTNDYTLEMLVDEWMIPLDNNYHAHTFSAFIPLPFNNVIVDELNVASDFPDVTLYPSAISVPNIITNDIYTTAAVTLNMEAIIAMCVLYCTEGLVPRVATSGAFGYCISGFDWDNVTLKIDINGVNVYSNYLFGSTNLAKNGALCNFLNYSGQFYMFDYNGAFGANTSICVNDSSGVTFTGTGADLIHKGTISDSWTGTIPANSTCKIYLQVEFGGSYKNSYNGNPSANVKQTLYGFCQALFTDNTWLKATVTRKYKNTTTKSFMIYEAFSRTAEAITGGNIRAYSEYYGRVDSAPYSYGQDGCGSLKTITSGLFLRQFPSHLDTGQAPNNKAKMIASFDMIFDAMNSIDCIGYGLEEDPNDASRKVVRIEPLNYFYDMSTVIMECDNVPEIRRTTKTDQYISRFMFGYTKFEAQSTMGLDEFNTKREYRNNLKTIKRTLDKKCDFIASGYTMEITRQLPMVDDATKDSTYDNDTFIICLNRNDMLDIQVEQGVDCIIWSDGIIDPPSIYNARISPIRNLIRWMKVLNHTYYPLWSDSMAVWIFSDGTANFNANMQLITGCVDMSDPIAENQTLGVLNLTDSDYGKPLSKPEVVDYDYPMSWTQYNAIKAYPYGVIKFREFDTNPWELGFVLDIKYSPEQGKAVFELLVAYQ